MSTTIKNNTKNEIVKIRVSKEEKETLKQFAASTNQTLSAYMLHKSMYTDSDFLKSLPDLFETWRRLNDICHEVEKCTDISLKNRINNILKKENSK